MSPFLCHLHLSPVRPSSSTPPFSFTVSSSTSFLPLLLLLSSHPLPLPLLLPPLFCYPSSTTRRESPLFSNPSPEHPSFCHPTPQFLFVNPFFTRPFSIGSSFYYHPTPSPLFLDPPYSPLLPRFPLSPFFSYHLPLHPSSTTATLPFFYHPNLFYHTLF